MTDVTSLDEIRQRRAALGVGLVLLLIGAGVLLWALKSKSSGA